MSLRTLSASALVTVLPLTTLTGVAFAASFSDVPSTHPNAEAIAYVKANGIVSGYSDGTYRPNQTINRAEFVKIVVHSRFSKQEIDDCLLHTNAASLFRDLKKDAWYLGSICTAHLHSIIIGYQDGTFRPSKPISFLEAATVLTKALSMEILANDIGYEAFVERLKRQHATGAPHYLDHAITRGEMAEMIYRLRENIQTERSEIYDDLESVKQSVYTSSHYNFRLRHNADWHTDGGILGSGREQREVVEMTIPDADIQARIWASDFPGKMPTEHDASLRKTQIKESSETFNGLGWQLTEYSLHRGKPIAGFDRRQFEAKTQARGREYLIAVDFSVESATVVPLETIIEGYHDKRYEEIIIRGNKIFAFTSSGSAMLAYKSSRESFSNLGFNDPYNPTTIVVQDDQQRGEVAALRVLEILLNGFALTDEDSSATSSFTYKLMSTGRVSGRLLLMEHEIQRRERRVRAIRSLRMEEVEIDVTKLPKNEPLNPGTIVVTVPTPGTSHTVNGEFVFEGTVPTEAYSVWVNDYRLRLYTPGKTNWNYIASPLLGTLKAGENVYVIVARDREWKIIDRLEYRVIYEP